MFFRRFRTFLISDLGILLLLALSRIILHAFTNGVHGFHRDELGLLDDARYLAWGYVTYPPLTPFLGRIAMEIFGQTNIAGIRFFSSLAQGAALVLAGLMARDLGGKRWVVVVTGIAVWIAPLSLDQGALFQYVSFDYLWWVLVAFCMLRLLKTENPRWWLGIGAAVGIGMMTKYTMGFFVVGLVGAVLLTPLRRYLKSRWLWAGAGLAVLIFLPNLLWQIQHNFISLQHLSTIHARDVEIGRTDTFLLDQFLMGTNPLNFPWWLAGVYFYLFSRAGRAFRPLGWMYVIPLALFILAKGRGYYLAPAYPMLLAAGFVIGERWLAGLKNWLASLLKGLTYLTFAAGGAFMLAFAIPAAPIPSPWWDFQSSLNTDLKEEIGWPELAQTVAHIRASLPAEDQARVGILANSYGEAGALNMYGPALGLPTTISAVNSHWLRGYGDPPPKVVIVVGYPTDWPYAYFDSCTLAGQIPNPYHLDNEEAKVPNIYVCRQMRGSWQEFWKRIQHFG